MENIWSILFITSLFIILTVIFYLIFRKPNTKEITESFSNSLLDNNLVTNGSFSEGQHPKEFSGHSGKNDIIIHPNNGQSSYVLRQGHHKKMQKDDELYYKLEFNLKPNTLYYLGCLYFSTNNNPLHHKVVFNGQQTQNLKTMEEPRRSTGGSDFVYKFTMFRTPNEGKAIHTEILISYQFNDIQGYNYITDIGLYEILDNNNIPVTEDLRTYFNCYNHESIYPSRELIKDLSQNGFDFRASNPSNIDIGNINLTNNSIIGPNAFKLQNENMLALNHTFTSFIFVKGTNLNAVNLKEEFALEEEEPSPVIIPKDATEIITFPGNQGVAFALILPKKYGKIYLMAGGMTYETEISHLSSLDSIFAVTYNGNRLKLYLNEQIVFATVTPKIFFDNKPVIINPNKDFMGNLFAFAYYNRELNENQIISISKYFIKMKAIGKELASVSLKMIENVATFIVGEPKRKREHKKDEKKDDGKKGEPVDDNCPKVIIDNKHYFVIVPNGSKLAEEVGYCGIRDYGTNIDTARQIFETNFPKCPVPDILDKRKYRGDMRKCPFVLLTEENPCRKWDCRDVDWTKGEVKDGNCKKAIDTYCSKHSETDAACFCWKKENRDNVECLKWRGRFEDKDNCDFRKHNIKDHPDADKWIEKDKIPCWGCNLTAPESAGQAGVRKGSGGR